MSNPTFRFGPITFKAGAELKKYTLVGIQDGKVTPADGTGRVFGAVTEQAAPATTRGDRDLALGLPEDVAVHVCGVVPIITDADDFAAGDDVFAAAEGKAAKTGTIKVGWAAGSVKSGRVRVVLALPGGAAA